MKSELVPTGEPVFFAVERGPQGDRPSLCYDVLPARLTRKIPKDSAEQPPAIYVLRLDLLPDAERWCSTPLAELYSRYCELRDAGKLPPSNLHVTASKAADPTRRQLGEWWEPPAATWDTSAPFVRPEVGSLKADAGAFIGPDYIAVAFQETEHG